MRIGGMAAGVAGMNTNGGGSREEQTTIDGSVRSGRMSASPAELSDTPHHDPHGRETEPKT
jgi:hypothetical protein